MDKHTLYIARHGITKWNQIGKIQGQSNDLKLSTDGIMQMHSLGKYLAKIEKSYLVVLSPMRRAQQSLQIVNKYLNIKQENIHTLNEMKEMSFGDFEGKLKSEIKTHPFFEERKTNKWQTSYPNGESYAALFQRLSNSKLSNIYQTAIKKGIPLLTIGHESINRVIPQILLPKIETNEQASKNRQQNNEIIVIKGNLRKKLIFD